MQSIRHEVTWECSQSGRRTAAAGRRQSIRAAGGLTCQQLTAAGRRAPAGERRCAGASTDRFSVTLYISQYMLLAFLL